MANKKWKLSDGDLWATDGVYDFGQSKTQRQVNASVASDLSSLNGANDTKLQLNRSGRSTAITACTAGAVLTTALLSPTTDNGAACGSGEG